MAYYLSKVLPLLLLPISVSLLAALLAFVFIFKGKRVPSLVSLLASILVLWVSALPVVAGQLVWSLEGQTLLVPTEEIPSADCMVVLGGALRRAPYPMKGVELTNASDRVYQAAKLFRSGKARTIIVAAGNQPWNLHRAPEAELIRELLVEWGVSHQSVVLDSASKNTRENALNSAIALRENGCRSNLLVTSALHMPRAVAAFKKAGVDVFPVSTDLNITQGDSDSVAAYIPSADALAATSTAIREWMGIWVYRWRGWN